MKKSFWIVIGCLVAIVFFQAFTTHQQPPWKNLQILPQDISKEGLDSVMDNFTASLNVKCNFCHVRNNETQKMDFPNDAKPEKAIARKMMQMTIDINMNHFNAIEDSTAAAPIKADSAQYLLKYVTCYTCHKGTAHPDNIPPAPAPKPAPPPGAVAPVKK